MVSTGLVGSRVHEGDEVVLAEGSYQGTLGTFLRLQKDIHWADITERNGRIRSHPMVWLAHATSETPGYGWNHGAAEDHNGRGGIHR